MAQSSLPTNGRPTRRAHKPIHTRSVEEEDAREEKPAASAERARALLGLMGPSAGARVAARRAKRSSDLEERAEGAGISTPRITTRPSPAVTGDEG